MNHLIADLTGKATHVACADSPVDLTRTLSAHGQRPEWPI
jgi:hypothetical protein